jgi:hypothetical protein
MAIFLPRLPGKSGRRPGRHRFLRRHFARFFLGRKNLVQNQSLDPPKQGSQTQLSAQLSARLSAQLSARLSARFSLPNAPCVSRGFATVSEGRPKATPRGPAPTARFRSGAIRAKAFSAPSRRAAPCPYTRGPPAQIRPARARRMAPSSAVSRPLPSVQSFAANTQHRDAIRFAQGEKSESPENSWNEMRILAVDFRRMFLSVRRLERDAIFSNGF